MPRWESGFLQPPGLVEAVTAPIEAKLLSPADLKAALVSLASKGMLTQLPADTLNLLAFNNITSSP
jgi:cerevisin